MGSECIVRASMHMKIRKIRSESKLNLNIKIQKRASILHHGINTNQLIQFQISLMAILQYLLYFNKLVVRIHPTMLTNIANYTPPTLLLQPIFKSSLLFSQIATYFSQLFLRNSSINLKKLFFTIGLASLTYSFGHFLYRQCQFWKWLPAFFRRRKQEQFTEFRKKYGRCYVLITGAADGIGYAFAREWAKLGFDLLLVDIQKDKLMFRTREIIQTFKDIQVESFVVDMSNMQQIGQFLTQIQRYQIGILVNNVGLTGGGKYLQISPQLISKTLAVNYLPMYTLTQHLLPKLRERVQRSAIINLSSATGVYFSHYVGAYSSIKHAVDIYSRTLSIQNRDKIDVLSVRPFGVSTGMMKMRKQQRIITPKKCVQSILSELGTADQCFSGKEHKIMGSFFASLSEAERLKVYDAAWEKNRKANQ